MCIPGIDISTKEEELAEEAGESKGRSGSKARVVDDGLTPEMRRKNQLDEDENFKKYRLMLKMG